MAEGGGAMTTSREQLAYYRLMIADLDRKQQNRTKAKNAGVFVLVLVLSVGATLLALFSQMP